MSDALEGVPHGAGRARRRGDLASLRRHAAESAARVCMLDAACVAATARQQTALRALGAAGGRASADARRHRRRIGSRSEHHAADGGGVHALQEA
jgi:hypothetical protein